MSLATGHILSGTGFFGIVLCRRRFDFPSQIFYYSIVRGQFPGALIHSFLLYCFLAIKFFIALMELNEISWLSVGLMVLYVIKHTVENVYHCISASVRKATNFLIFENFAFALITTNV